MAEKSVDDWVEVLDAWKVELTAVYVAVK